MKETDSTAGFLCNGTIDILDQIILCCSGGGGSYSLLDTEDSIPVIHHETTVAPPLKLPNQKCLWTRQMCPCGQNHYQLRTTALINQSKEVTKKHKHKIDIIPILGVNGDRININI